VANEKVGIRKTNQREGVVQVLKESNGPLTPQEILERTQKVTSNVGIATIYRTIKLLSETNKIIMVTLPDGQTRYEMAHLDHHHHFKCRTCLKIFDLQHCPIEIGKSLSLPNGFTLEGHEITLFGICADCQK
jgi:Fur family ferric uptake transcriptional regulator